MSIFKVAAKAGKSTYDKLKKAQAKRNKKIEKEKPPSARKDMANRGERNKSFDEKLKKDLGLGLGAGAALAGTAIITHEARKREAKRMEKDKQRINKLRGIGQAKKGFGKAMKNGG
jgi:hypothetical protein